MQEKNDVTEIKVHFQIPFEVTIKMGQIVSAPPAGLPGAGSPVGASALTAALLSMDAALELVKQTLAANPAIIKIRKGYRFKNGRITDEKVIVVEVKEKLDFKDLMGTGKKPLPREIMGVGIDGGDATIGAAEDMQARIGNKFSHVWASTQGKKRLIPTSYHLRVACRDGEELWLSSGNWKTSNQPRNVTTFAALTGYNREWHAIIKNDTLTKLVQRYIEYDFGQATLFPIEIKESSPMEAVEVFVPATLFAISPERIKDVDYEPELIIKGEVLDIQPLLTPDRDAEGDRMFIKHATNMVRRATRKIYVQNQSFNMTEENNEELDEFFEELRKRQRAIGDVRIILRDARDYHQPADLEKQQLLIERLKDFGFDTSLNSLKPYSFSTGTTWPTTRPMSGSGAFGSRRRGKPSPKGSSE